MPENPRLIPGPVKRVQLGTSEAGPGISGPLVLDAMRDSVRNNFGLDLPKAASLKQQVLDMLPG